MKHQPATRTAALECPDCHSPIAPSDVNMELMVGMCRACNQTIELRRPNIRARPPAELLKIMSPPSGITLKESDQGLRITRRWLEFGPTIIVMTLWCIIWDGILAVFYAGALVTFLGGESAILGTMLFTILHFIVGLGMTYVLVALYINKTVLTVRDTHLSVSHGPLPWRAPAPIPVRSIKQLYLVHRIQKNNRTFNLVVQRTDRTSVEILTGLTRDNQARFMEQRIEQYLGIEDEAVDGEYNG